MRMGKGPETMLREAEIRLKAKRGKLRFNRDYGSRLYLLSPRENQEQYALSMAQEALRELNYLSVNAVSCDENGFHITVKCPYGTGEIFVERSIEND